MLFIGQILTINGAKRYILNDQNTQSGRFMSIDVERIGENISRLAPNTYTITLVTCMEEEFNHTQYSNVVEPWSIEIERLLPITIPDDSGLPTLLSTRLWEFRYNEPGHCNFLWLSENQTPTTIAEVPFRSLIRNLVDSIRKKHINGSKLLIPALFNDLSTTSSFPVMTQSDILQTTELVQKSFTMQKSKVVIFADAQFSFLQIESAKKLFCEVLGF